MISEEVLKKIADRWADIYDACGDSEVEQGYIDIALLLNELRRLNVLILSADISLRGKNIQGAVEALRVAIEEREA